MFNNDSQAESFDNADRPEVTAELPQNTALDRLRVLPLTIPFGLQAAALAGLAVAAGAAAVGLHSLFDDPTSVTAFPGPVCSKGDYPNP